MTENIPNITPDELADKMENLVDTVQELSKSNAPENQWAREAMAIHSTSCKYAPDYFKKEGVTIPIDKLKELYPELYDIVNQGIEQSNNASSFYQKPLPLTHLSINKHQDTVNYFTSSLSYNNKIELFSSIIINTQDTRQKSIPNLISAICHELGHFRQKVGWAIKERLVPVHPEELKKHPDLVEPDDPHLEEHLADNEDKSRNRLGCLLSYVISNSILYDYDDRKPKQDTHPTNRKRIEVTLKRVFLDETFKLYGTWNEHNGKYSFQPINVKDAHPTIKERIANQLRHEKLGEHDGVSYAQRLHREKPVTEEGKIIANHPRLNKEAGKQVAELMSQLDGLVTSGFDEEKKQQWLDAVDKKVAKFKEKHPIDTIKMDGYRLHILQAEELAKKPHTR